MDDDEIIECPFEKPIDDEKAKIIGNAVGFRKGNGLLFNKKGQCVGYACHPEDIEQIRSNIMLLNQTASDSQSTQPSQPSGSDRD